ncbi:MAG: hypothetical protein HY940_03215 [Gammaproteobacteria bacterium]|nr:hypothetical protein [Gammaproteobacteria bacterium]
MHTLVLNPTAVAQWQALLAEAQSSASRHLDEQLESYLVFMLMRFTEHPGMFERLMALDYLNSQHASGSVRQAQLRDVGDHCLLFSGLFPHIARRRLVSISYFIGVGRSAYQQMASELETLSADLYQRLSSDFILLMEILQTIRQLGQPKGLPDPLQAFELWADTGSAHALQHHTRSTSSPAPQSAVPAATDTLIIH